MPFFASWSRSRFEPPSGVGSFRGRAHLRNALLRIHDLELVARLPELRHSAAWILARPDQCAKLALMSLDFLITSLIIVASPGTGVLYTLAAGLSRGSRASVVAAFGCTLGIVPHMAAAILGLA